MIRVAVRRRPCQGSGCWSGSILRMSVCGMSVWGGGRVGLSGEQVPGASRTQFDIITGRITAR